MKKALVNSIIVFLDFRTRKKADIKFKKQENALRGVFGEQSKPICQHGWNYGVDKNQEIWDKTVNQVEDFICASWQKVLKKCKSGQGSKITTEVECDCRINILRGKLHKEILMPI